jgi:hypothetical protein
MKKNTQPVPKLTPKDQKPAPAAPSTAKTPTGRGKPGKPYPKF